MLKKIIFTSFMLFVLFTTKCANASDGGLDVARVTGPNQITVTYIHTIIGSTVDSYSNLGGDLTGHNIISASEYMNGGEDNIVLTFDGAPVAKDATGTIDIADTVIYDEMGHFLGENGVVVQDGQQPYLASVSLNDFDHSGTLNTGDLFNFYFNEAMDTSTITAYNVDAQLSLNNDHSFGTTANGLIVAWSPDGKILTVTLGSDNTVTSGDTVSATSLVTDIAGNLNNTPHPILLPTTDLPPTITSVTPSDEAQHVFINEPIIINFSEPVNTSVTVSTSPCLNICVTYSKVWSNNNMTLTLTNDEYFAINTLYTIEISNVYDSTENPIANPYTWSFTTISPYVLTEVTPIPTRIKNVTTTTYTFSVSGFGQAEYLAEQCGHDSEISMTHITEQPEAQQFIIHNLKAGKTYRCSFLVKSKSGGPLMASNQLFVGPFTVGSATSTSSGSLSIQSRVDNLENMGQHDQAETLRKQFPSVFSDTNTIISTTTPPVTQVGETPLPFLKNLSKGMKDKDVSLLQSFLITQNIGPGAKALAANGATNFFGSLTKKALIEFQKAKGISPSVGLFGPITRGVVNRILKNRI